ncbi:hypothetical protein PQX77_022059 [Marasmius sp. AFHP31]|nr:hypothetical protein PQX77_022059 [Marasmius sp. AFHP31]
MLPQEDRIVVFYLANGERRVFELTNLLTRTCLSDHWRLFFEYRIMERPQLRVLEIEGSSYRWDYIGQQHELTTNVAPGCIRVPGGLIKTHAWNTGINFSTHQYYILISSSWYKRYIYPSGMSPYMCYRLNSWPFKLQSRSRAEPAVGNATPALGYEIWLVLAFTTSPFFHPLSAPVTTALLSFPATISAALELHMVKASLHSPTPSPPSNGNRITDSATPRRNAALTNVDDGDDVHPRKHKHKHKNKDKRKSKSKLELPPDVGYAGDSGKCVFREPQRLILLSKFPHWQAAKHGTKSQVARKLYNELIKLPEFPQPPNKTPAAWKNNIVKWFDNHDFKLKKAITNTEAAASAARTSGGSQQVMREGTLVNGMLTVTTGREAYGDAHPGLVEQAVLADKDGDHDCVLSKLWEALDAEAQEHWEKVAAQSIPMSQNQQGASGVTLVSCFDSGQVTDGVPITETWMSNEWSDPKHTIPDANMLPSVEPIFTTLHANLLTILKQKEISSLKLETTFPTDKEKCAQFIYVNTEDLSPGKGRTILQDWFQTLWDVGNEVKEKALNCADARDKPQETTTYLDDTNNNDNEYGDVNLEITPDTDVNMETTLNVDHAVDDASGKETDNAKSGDASNFSDNNSATPTPNLRHPEASLCQSPEPADDLDANRDTPLQPKAMKGRGGAWITSKTMPRVSSP